MDDAARLSAAIGGRWRLGKDMSPVYGWSCHYELRKQALSGIARRQRSRTHELISAVRKIRAYPCEEQPGSHGSVGAPILGIPSW